MSENNLLFTKRDMRLLLRKLDLLSFETKYGGSHCTVVVLYSDVKQEIRNLILIAENQPPSEAK